MPKLSDDTKKVEQYLRGRGIHPIIIRHCIENKLLFETADFHSALFMGYDRDGKARYGSLRGTTTQYENHKMIKFDTLSSLGEYEVVAVFKFDTNHEKFKYNEYTQMDEEQFAEFMENVHARQLYDTGVDAKYGDQLLTLSTCEYTYDNGRLAVIAKRN